MLREAESKGTRSCTDKTDTLCVERDTVDGTRGPIAGFRISADSY